MALNIQIELEDQRAELRAVLASEEFARAPAMAKLLTYLCEKTFEGKVHEIKEFSIATEVYGRNQHFDNLLNHPVWGNPNTSFSNPNYGRVTSTVGSMRQMQFSLKYVF